MLTLEQREKDRIKLFLGIYTSLTLEDLAELMDEEAGEVRKYIRPLYLDNEIFVDLDPDTPSKWIITLNDRS